VGGRDDLRMKVGSGGYSAGKFILTSMGEYDTRGLKPKPFLLKLGRSCRERPNASTIF
jgi:hypothetical protein